MFNKTYVTIKVALKFTAEFNEWKFNFEMIKRRILVKPLPAYGNKGLKKKDLVKSEWFYLIISLLILHVWIALLVLLVLCIYFLLV